MDFNALGTEWKIAAGTLAKVGDYFSGVKCTRCLYFLSFTLGVLLAADAGQTRCLTLPMSLMRDGFDTFHSNYTRLIVWVKIIPVY